MREAKRNGKLKYVEARPPDELRWATKDAIFSNSSLRIECYASLTRAACRNVTVTLRRCSFDFTSSSFRAAFISRGDVLKTLPSHSSCWVEPFGSMTFQAAALMSRNVTDTDIRKAWSKKYRDLKLGSLREATRRNIWISDRTINSTDDMHRNEFYFSESKSDLCMH